MVHMAAALRQACGPTSPLLPAALAAASFLLPAPAWAHVKWFAPFDVAEPPTPVEGLLAPRFLLVLAGFALLVFGGFLLDRLASRSGRGGILAAPGRRGELEERLMRAGTGAFFVALFTAGRPARSAWPPRCAGPAAPRRRCSPPPWPRRHPSSSRCGPGRT